MNEIGGQMMMTDVADMVERHQQAQYVAFEDKFKRDTKGPGLMNRATLARTAGAFFCA